MKPKNAYTDDIDSERNGRRRSFKLILFVVAAAIVVLALALGLGLGLGLKHKNSSSAQATSQPASSTPSFAPLQAQDASNFVLNQLIGQPPQTRVFNFTVSQVQGAPDGFSRPMLTVNNIYPGPTIEANQGDRLVINVHNNLPNVTSIHWHGLFQNGTNFYDGTIGITECGIPPGQSLTYNFTLGSFSGTTWWHSHGTQYSDGITGSLIVHPTAPSPPGFPAWNEEIVVQMADWYHQMSGVILAQYLSPNGIDGTPGDDPVPDAATLNGLGQYGAAGSGGTYFNFTLQSNRTYRIRLSNTGSFAAMRFSVDYHPLTLIEADGTLLAPTTVAGVTIAVAQRYSVLLTTNATASPNGTYWMRATMQTTMFKYGKPGQNIDIRGIIRYADAPSSGLPGNPASANPGLGVNNLPDVDGTTQLASFTPNPAPAATRSYAITASFQNTPGGIFLAFMNSTSWTPLLGETTLMATQNNPLGYALEGSGTYNSSQFIVTEDSIQVVDLQVTNYDDLDHPFHLHGHRPWGMAVGVGGYTDQALNNTNPLQRDTVLIPANSYVVLRFITDNPGLWAFHCHIAWHMAAGLLMQISSLPSKAAQLNIPQDIISQCAYRA